MALRGPHWDIAQSLPAPGPRSGGTEGHCRVCGFKLGAKDVFLNIAGGLRVEDPAIDLAVVSAVLSSNSEISIPQNICFAAEVGLAGEIRAISRVEQRIQEAEKLGFKKIIISKFNKIAKKNYAIEMIKVGKIEEVIKVLFQVY